VYQLRIISKLANHFAPKIAVVSTSADLIFFLTKTVMNIMRFQSFLHCCYHKRSVHKRIETVQTYLQLVQNSSKTKTSKVKNFLVVLMNFVLAISSAVLSA